MRVPYGDEYDFVESVHVLKERIKEVQSGDMSGMEAMLVGQAHALQQVFVALMRKGYAQEHLKQYQTHMNLGLKAQAQCRATIQALTELKYPRQVVITKQANFAQGHQQVNNSAHPQENAMAQNELLEVNDGSQTMDIGAAARTGRKNKELATLEQSTGAKTAQGKAASSKNAYKGGGVGKIARIAKGASGHPESTCRNAG
ncbi:hypothetical protein EDC26_101177 [Paralcaligenes ureilyticus]|uniref:Uncharacterized protein n=2 Tax=Paralcaligenes ureilyticus TaxID=627131 RepID=A0A4R3MH19_9BURK|nr:hypothetical protein EDC26_101177 [Paralcaligenes ureilyticus]